MVRGQHQRSMQRAVLDRFASGQELAVFLQSPLGERFLRGLSEGMSNPASSILACVHRGIVIVLLGVGFLVVGKLEPWGAAPIALGILLLCLGLGFLVSGGVSYRISKAWRLLDGAGKQNDR